jgi:predicted peptidase
MPGEQRASVLDTTVRKHVSYRYFVYVPEDYGHDATKRYPLVLFLHGAGERGDDVNKVTIHGPTKLIAAGQDFDFILLAPQCPAGQWWHVDDLEVLLDDAMHRYPADPDRIYLTGLSMGGCATWDWILRDPTRFAAAVPVCGWGNPAFARLAPPATPVWAFHGEADPLIPVEGSTLPVKALQEAKRAEVKVTVYPKVRHDSWSATYANPDVYRWMLAQRRARTDKQGASRRRDD